MADPTRPATNPIPDTTAPRQPAQAPAPIPTPQPTPGTQDATRPGVNQTDAAQVAPAVPEDRSSTVQRSGGGADNQVAGEELPVNPTTGS